MQPGKTSATVSSITQGGSGSNGSDGGLFINATSGDPGQAGPPVNGVNFATAPPTAGKQGLVYNAGGAQYNAAVFLQSTGGSGGTGGTGYLFANSAPGGVGGAGGAISSTIGVQGSVVFLTTVASTPGIWARSLGGNGGDGGNGYLGSNGNNGAPGGSGGTITLTIGANIYTLGNNSAGILAQSIGGNGGSGGKSSWTISGSGGNGASGQSGGSVNVTLTTGGSILTAGAKSVGILAQSIGGFGGSGGSGSGLVTFGGNGSSGGLGGTLSVTTQTNTSLVTLGVDSDGILAESVGGGGGAGGASGALFAGGGSGSIGGTGSSVTVN
ncbi:MAG TPA: hypothetical protein VF778_04835, partial [Xanthobacteraceae bacterium]